MSRGPRVLARPSRAPKSRWVSACLVTLLVSGSVEARDGEDGESRVEKPDAESAVEDSQAAVRARRLTSDGVLKTHPVYRRRGEELEVVFSIDRRGFQPILARVGIAGGAPVPLHREARLPEFCASFAADGKSYAHLQSRGNQNITLVFRREGEKGEKHLDNTARNARLSLDGERVWYSKPDGGKQQIAWIATDGRTRGIVARSSAFDNWPAPSPDGKRVLFASDREDRDIELWVVGADDKGLRRLTRSPGRDFRPAWSPDGKWIAFTSSRTGDSDVWVTRADGTGARNVSRHPERDDYATWHPDGRHVLFVGERGGRYDLWEVEVFPPAGREDRDAGTDPEAVADDEAVGDASTDEE